MRTTFVALVVVFIARAAIADDERVTVRIVGKDGTDIEQAAVGDASSVTWRPLCTAPCTARVAPESVLRAVGGLPSEPLKLDGVDTMLVAKRASSSRAETSNELIVAGAALLVGAGVALPVASALAIQNALCFFCSPSNKTTQDVLFVTGGVSAVVGGVLFVAGFQIRPSARATLVVAGNGASLTYKW